MSFETAVLLRLRELGDQLAKLQARLDTLSPAPWPSRMNTSEAVQYVRQVYHRPGFCAGTLRLWRRKHRLSDIRHPARWDREELDHELSGRVTPTETRGRRLEVA